MNTEAGFSVGDDAYLSRSFMTPDLELEGAAGERVRIMEIDHGKPYPYLVQGPTCNGKPFRVKRVHLTNNRPMTPARLPYND